MKIAVASADGETISRHFGRSACFLVFEVDGQSIVGKEVRDNTYTAHAKGQCAGGHDDHEQDHHHHDQPHSHAEIVSALHDCHAVLCHGMGRLAADDLRHAGIEPVLIGFDLTPEEAVKAYLAGQLQSGGTFCRCSE